MAKKSESISATASNLPHPRETVEWVGHASAEAQLRRAHDSGRLAHAWLITGPKGIGKATLAHRFARFLLAEEARMDDKTLAVSADVPAVKRAMGGSHADFMVLEAGEKGNIGAEEARAIGNFLAHTPAEGRWRVVVVDAVDAMNSHAANAILKTLEEPPARAILILVSHNPGILLPTIRSRCRALKLGMLSQADFLTIVNYSSGESEAEKHAYYALSGGSPGVALFLMEQGALPLYQAMLELFNPPQAEPDWIRAHGLASQLAGKQETAYFDAFQHVLQHLFTQLVKAAELGEDGLPEEMLTGEHAAILHLAGFKTSAQWLALWENVSRLLHDVHRIHLDRKQVVLNIIAAMQPSGHFQAA